jgi:hypothetical protein
MTLHAEEQMEEDGFDILDVENALLAGHMIERQTDRQSRVRKYLIRGPSVDDGRDLVVVVRFGPTDFLVILTVYGD